MAPALGRGDDLAEAALGVDVVLITTSDDAIRRVAAAIAPRPETVVAHCSGAHTLEVLEPHPRRASVHPLASIPDEHIGAERLPAGCSFAVDGDPLIAELVEAVGGRAFRVDPADRVRYHAAAVMASNHLVALLGQVQRVAADAGLPVDAYLDLVEQTLANVRRLGPAAALTGPVARGDWATVYRHLLAIGPAERHAYEAMASQASRLAGRDEPSVGPLDRSAGDAAAARRGEPGRSGGVSAIEVVGTIAEVRERHDSTRGWGGVVGLVPTMGYLHTGHASLMAAARRHCDLVTATLFVNPLQFGPSEDLSTYPRDLDRDVALAEAAGVDLLFAPPVEEMYPLGRPLTTVTVDGARPNAGRAPPAPATSPAWPPWWPSCSPSPGRVGPTSG